MATKPAEEAPEQLMYKTWSLKVSIHCEGCKKKVRKVLQGIEGVYKVDIDAQQQKVTVTGNVEAETLLKKLLRSGKQSELWPENPSNKSNKKKKKDKSNKDNNNPNGQEAGVNNNIDNDDDEDNEKAPPHATESSDHDGEELPEGEEEEETPTGETPSAPAGGKKKKNKKKKNKGQNGNVDLEPSMLPSQQVYPSGPQMYYPSQPMAYGLSYNAAFPSASESFYTTPVYGHYGSNYRYHPLSDRIYLEGDHDHFDYHDEDEVGCSIM